jgi:hypothetical protein
MEGAPELELDPVVPALALELVVGELVVAEVVPEPEVVPEEEPVAPAAPDDERVLETAAACVEADVVAPIEPS